MGDDTTWSPTDSAVTVSVMMDLLVKQRSLHGIYRGSSNIREDIPYCAELYLPGRLNLDDLIAQEIELEGINEAYELQETGAIARSVIRF